MILQLQIHFFFYKLTDKKNCVYGKFPLVIFKTPMFQPLKGYYQGVRTVTGMHTCNTSVHIQCEVMCEDSGVRDVYLLLSGVQKCTQIHLWQKVWWSCFCGSVHSQVCFLHMFVFTDLGLRNCYIYIYVRLLCMWHGLGITCTPALWME
jgi:hypothetical protein